jgi:HPt (histidine-containing phosphotransfer) domain-containing protein
VLPVALAPAASATEELPDLPGIDIALLMQRMHGRVKSCRRLLGLFRDQYIGAEARMRELLAVGDSETLHRFAHTLKGASSGLGAERVRQASAQLEEQMIDGEATSQTLALNEVVEALNEVFPGLSAL